ATSVEASAKPFRETTMRWMPTGRSSMRHSPRSSLAASRRSAEEASITILAAGIRAPPESSTVPRKLPRGFCAGATQLPSKTTAKQQRARSFILRIRLFESALAGRLGQDQRRDFLLFHHLVVGLQIGGGDGLPLGQLLVHRLGQCIVDFVRLPGRCGSGTADHAGEGHELVV